MKPKFILCLALVLGSSLFCFDVTAQSQSKTNEWSGFQILSAITNANPAIRNSISVRLPTQLKIERTANMLSVTIGTNRMESTNLLVGTNMVIGFQGQEFVYPVGGLRPASRGESLTGSLEFGSSTLFYHTQPDGIPQAGQSYVVEMDLTIFETDIPPQHAWSPQGSKNYKILWQRTLKQKSEPVSVIPMGDNALLYTILSRLRDKVPELSAAKLSDGAPYGSNTVTARYTYSDGKLKIIAKAYDSQAAAKEGQESDSKWISVNADKTEIINGVPIHEYTRYGGLYFQTGFYTFRFEILRCGEEDAQPSLLKICSALITELDSTAIKVKQP